MADNIEIHPLGVDVGGYKAGTIMATVQNADLSHSTRVVIDGVYSSSDPLTVETVNDGYESAANSTPTAGVSLAGGATWSGASDSPLNYGGVRIIVYSDQNSAANGLKVYCSNDGVNFLLDDQYTILAGGVKTFAATVAPYIKVTYTNGTTPATVRVCTLFLKHMSVVSSHRIQDNLNDDDDGALTVSVLKLKTAQNTYVSGTATSAGNFKTSIEEIESGVIMPVTRADDFYNDAFQWQRTSQKNKRFDFDFNLGKNPFLWDEVGNGTATFDANSRDVVLAIGGTASTDSEAMIQHYYNIYTPLYSQAIGITGTINNGAKSGTCRAFLRSTVTGTTTEEYVAVPVGMADFSKSAIFVMDFQSLRVGRIRFGLDQSGIFMPVGQITNDNERATGYWQTANLPIQWRIYNTATNTITEMCYGDDKNGIGFQFVSALDATQTIRAICAGVASEGGGNLLDLEGFQFIAPPVTAPIVAAKTVSTALIPLLSIRVAATLYSLENRGLVIPTGLTIQTSNPIEYAVIYRPVLTGASWVAVGTDSGVEYDITAGSFTGGYQIDADFISSGQNQVALVRNILGKEIMSLGSAGVPDILTIAAIRTSTTDASVRSKLKWKEIR